MYSHLFANWQQVYTEAKIVPFKPDCPYCKFYQPLHIIKKVASADDLIELL